jgi:hypothetical protein
MKTKEKEELINRFVYECSCGCTELRFEQWKDDGLAFISLMVPAQHGGHYTSLKTTIKIIWNLIRGKQYCLYDIVIEDNDTLRRFKKFVADMKEIDEL